MADTRTITDQLKIENYFVDGDTRTITLKNPKTNIAQEEIQELQAFMHANNIIVGDKMGATFGKIMTVTSVRKTRIDLDINS